MATATDLKDLIKASFEESFTLRTEKAGLEERLDILESKWEELKGLVREIKASLKEIEGPVPENTAERAERFNRSFALRTGKVALKEKLSALGDKMEKLEDREDAIVETLGEIEGRILKTILREEEEKVSNASSSSVPGDFQPAGASTTDMQELERLGKRHSALREGQALDPAQREDPETGDVNQPDPTSGVQYV